jgi:hypothetical protein
MEMLYDCGTAIIGFTSNLKLQCEHKLVITLGDIQIIRITLYLNILMSFKITSPL